MTKIAKLLFSIIRIDYKYARKVKLLWFSFFFVNFVNNNVIAAFLQRNINIDSIQSSCIHLHVQAQLKNFLMLMIKNTTDRLQTIEKNKYEL